MDKTQKILLSALAIITTIVSIGLLIYVLGNYQLFRASCSSQATKGGQTHNILITSIVANIIALSRIHYPEKMKLTAYKTEPIIFICIAISIFILAILGIANCRYWF
jgi:hypothetical protein